MVSFSKKNNPANKKVARKEAGAESQVAAMKSWYQDRYQTAIATRNMMFFIMLFAFALAGASVFTVSVLSESKVFEPYLIQVEERTGIITQVSGQSIERYTDKDWVIRYFMMKYLKAREGYDPNNSQFNYSTVVRLMSTTPVYRQFLSIIDKEANKQSPLNLPPDTALEVALKSITMLEKKKWQVRFAVRKTRLVSNITSEVKDYISTIGFEFKEDMELSQDDRYVNPLGFQVTSYRRDEERVFKDVSEVQK